MIGKSIVHQLDGLPWTDAREPLLREAELGLEARTGTGHLREHIAFVHDRARGLHAQRHHRAHARRLDGELVAVPARLPVEHALAGPRAGVLLPHGSLQLGVPGSARPLLVAQLLERGLRLRLLGLDLFDLHGESVDLQPLGACVEPARQALAVAALLPLRDLPGERRAAAA